jgi:hypothetical protein
MGWNPEFWADHPENSTLIQCLSFDEIAFCPKGAETIPFSTTSKRKQSDEAVRT